MTGCPYRGGPSLRGPHQLQPCRRRGTAAIGRHKCERPVRPLDRHFHHRAACTTSNTACSQHMLGVHLPPTLSKRVPAFTQPVVWDAASSTWVFPFPEAPAVRLLTQASGVTLILYRAATHNYACQQSKSIHLCTSISTLKPICIDVSYTLLTELFILKHVIVTC